MTKKKNLDRKKLVAPDAFERGSANAVNWMKKNMILLSVLAVAAVVLVSVFFGSRYMKDSNNSKLRTELSAIDALNAEEVDGIKDQRDNLIKKVSDQTAEIAKIKKANATDPKIATLEASKKSLEKQLKDLLPDHSGSLQKYVDFYNSNKASPAGLMAGVQAAKIHVQKKDYASATPILNHVVENGGDFPFFDIQIRLYLVSLLEEQGEFKQAISKIDAVLKKPLHEDIMPLLLLTKGRLQIFDNDRENAVSTLNKIIKDHSKSYEASQAKQYKIYASRG